LKDSRAGLDIVAKRKISTAAMSRTLIFQPLGCHYHE
jgi:hypothetical protein